MMTDRLSVEDAITARSGHLQASGAITALLAYGTLKKAVAENRRREAERRENPIRLGHNHVDRVLREDCPRCQRLCSSMEA
jgi:hypothetical protein